ncbi:MAG: TraM recognition domain-containing protein [Nitrosospira sp.]
MSQLLSLVPGVRYSPEDNQPDHDWKRVIELGETDPARSLRIPSAEYLSASLLASVQALSEGEAVLMQWVVTPTVPQKLPSDRKPFPTSHWSYRLITGDIMADSDEVKDRRAKLSEANMLAVLRVAAKADTEARANHLLYRVQAALASVRSPNNRFKKRLVVERWLQDRLRQAASPLIFPAQLSASELVSLIAWPLGGPHVAGLPQGRARHLPATEAIPRVGRIIAISNFEGAERPLALSPIDSCKHTQVIGPTGVGKTTLLANLIAQDMEAGHGVILIESKGDLFQEALDRVPKDRLDDVVILDVNDTAFPVGFNILQGNPQIVAADIQRLFEHLYPQDTRGVRVRQGLYHAIMTLMASTNATEPMTFADIGPLCVPRADQVGFSDKIIRGVAGYEELALFWQELENMKRDQRAAYFGPIIDRVWQLNSRRSIRNIIGQSKSGFDMKEIISGNKILLVNLGRATEGSETAALVGSLLLNSIWSAVLSGTSSPASPTFLYLDEFQDFLNLPIPAQDMFAQARSKGLPMTVAHQFMGQLSRDLQDAVLANARSKVVFQTSSDDARLFAREFGKSVDDHDFMHLGPYEVIMRMATSDGVSAPVTGVTQPPGRRTGLDNAARFKSREKYGRPVADVEAEINNRRNLGEPKKAPKVNPREWR